MDVIVCQMRFISLSIFSVFAVVWNSLVGIVLLSVCRTNTMGSFIHSISITFIYKMEL